MMIHARDDGNGAELARHFNKACDRGLEHQLPEFRRRRGGVAADTLFREAAPPILPAIGAGFGVIPIEIFQFELTDVARSFIHLHEFREAVQHHRGFIFAGMTHAAPTALAIGIQHIGHQRD